MVEIWKILSKEAQLSTIILDHMLELLQKSLPYEEKGGDGKETVRKATQVPLAVSWLGYILWGNNQHHAYMSV